MRILTVDVGTGTQDIFLYDSSLDLENGYKLVLPSPTMLVHRRLHELRLLLAHIRAAGRAGLADADRARHASMLYRRFEGVRSTKRFAARMAT